MKGTVDKLLNFMKLSDDEEYDEEYEEYACGGRREAGERARSMQFKKATCPYFSYGDEYKLARKQ